MMKEVEVVGRQGGKGANQHIKETLIYSNLTDYM
jgi:hypothetical protein